MAEPRRSPGSSPLSRLILYVPVLNKPFGTYPLPLMDWVIVAAAAFTVSPVLEIAKWMERRGWFGSLAA